MFKFRTKQERREAKLAKRRKKGVGYALSILYYEGKEAGIRTLESHISNARSFNDFDSFDEGIKEVLDNLLTVPSKEILFKEDNLSEKAKVMSVGSEPGLDDGWG